MIKKCYKNIVKVAIFNRVLDITERMTSEYRLKVVDGYLGEGQSCHWEEKGQRVQEKVETCLMSSRPAWEAGTLDGKVEGRGTEK